MIYNILICQFNQSAVEAWVTLCNEKGELKRQGASAEVLEMIHIRVTKALVALIQEAQSTALLPQIRQQQRKWKWKIQFSRVNLKQYLCD